MCVLQGIHVYPVVSNTSLHKPSNPSLSSHNDGLVLLYCRWHGLLHGLHIILASPADSAQDPCQARAKQKPGRSSLSISLDLETMIVLRVMAGVLFSFFFLPSSGCPSLFVTSPSRYLPQKQWAVSSVIWSVRYCKSWGQRPSVWNHSLAKNVIYVVSPP